MDSDQRAVTIRFEGVSLRDAGNKAKDLRQQLLDASSAVTVDVQKDDPSTMDFGATLILVLGTPAVLAIASGIADYIRRDRGTLVIEKDGRVVFRGSSGDAARIAEALGGESTQQV